MMSTMPREGMMMGPMKGHLAPNSSPFKPTINKLSSQYLIQDHMSSHYNKLVTAKAAVDNKPPKSMMTSVKKRDQMKREAMAKQMKLLDFEKKVKHGSPQRQNPDYGSGMLRSYSVTVTKNGYDEVRPQTSSTFYSSRPSTRSMSLPRTPASSEQGTPRDKMDVLNKTYAGDYLDRHEDRFKHVDQPFTPRLKKRPGKSFLAQSKHYAPPLNLNKDVKRKTATGSSLKPKSTAESNRSLSPPAPNKMQTERSISRDSDNRKWTEDKSELIQRLTLDNTQQANESAFQKRLPETYQPDRNLASDLFFGTSSLGRSFASSRSDAITYERKHRIHEEEEEMKYLEFINQVTNDILTRGVYSDRVLTRVMERHVEENRGRLDEGRMRHMLKKLQNDLGMSSTAGLSSPDYKSPSPSSSLHKQFSANYRTKGNRTMDFRSSREGSSRESSINVSVRKKSPRYSAASRKRRENAESGHTSGSEASNSDGRRSVRKGILKNPGDVRSSGSEQDLRSNVSSAEERSGDESRRRLSDKVDKDKEDATPSSRKAKETDSEHESGHLSSEGKKSPTTRKKNSRTLANGLKNDSEDKSDKNGSEQPIKPVVEKSNDALAQTTVNQSDTQEEDSEFSDDDF